MLSSLKKETTKVQELNPNEYYVCCAVRLTPGNKSEIFKLFSNYMKGSGNIMSLNDIEEYLQNSENMDIVRKHYKLWLESTNILPLIVNRDIFIDCETLFYNIENDQKKFVATSSYEQCVKVLEHERLLDRTEYYWDCDLYELFNSNMIYNGECMEVDVPKVVDIVADTTQENMYIDIKDKLDVFPENVKDAMDFSSYNIEIDKDEIESYVYDILNDPGERDYGDFYDDCESYSDHSRQMDELDFIFAE